MSKVFAVVKEDDGELKLLSWRSKRAFERDNSWLDERFLHISTTAEHQQNNMYVCHDEYIDPSTPMRDNERFRVLTSKESVDAHNMLVDAFHAHFKQRVSNEKK